MSTPRKNLQRLNIVPKTERILTFTTFPGARIVNQAGQTEWIIEKHGPRRATATPQAPGTDPPPKRERGWRYWLAKLIP